MWGRGGGGGGGPGADRAGERRCGSVVGGHGGGGGEAREGREGGSGGGPGGGPGPAGARAREGVGAPQRSHLPFAFAFLLADPSRPARGPAIGAWCVAPRALTCRAMAIARPTGVWHLRRGVQPRSASEPSGIGRS